MAFTRAGLYTESLTDDRGNSLKLTQFTLTDPANGDAPVTTYTDATKTTVRTGLLYSDSDGNVSFYSDPGIYTLTVPSTGKNFPVQVAINADDIDVTVIPSLALSNEIARATTAEESGIANTTSAIEDHRAHGVHAEPQPPMIGNGPDKAVAGNDARLTDQRVSPVNSVTPAQLTEAVQALFDSAGSANAVQEQLDAFIGQASRAFVTVPTQTSPYAATANQIVPLDTTGGAFTCPLPSGTSLQNGDTVAYRLMAISGTNYPTIVASGSDTINGTSQSQQIKLVDQVVSFVWTGTGWIGGFGNKSLVVLPVSSSGVQVQAVGSPR